MVLLLILAAAVLPQGDTEDSDSELLAQLKRFISELDSRSCKSYYGDIVSWSLI